MIPDSALLLYDGTCGFCARGVQFVLHHERRRRTLRFATLQGARGDEVRRAYPSLAAVDSMVLLLPPADGREGSLLVRSEAALAVGVYLGGGWRALAAAARIVPRAVRDAVYD
ncbi:MAG: thiol-disulfide oxidoreductase DCC family protein, partial [Gemmatimonadaceae bacterium]